MKEKIKIKNPNQNRKSQQVCVAFSQGVKILLVTLINCTISLLVEPESLCCQFFTKHLLTNPKLHIKLKECHISDHLAALTIHLLYIITSMNHKLHFKLGD